MKRKDQGSGMIGLLIVAVIAIFLTMLYFKEGNKKKPETSNPQAALEKAKDTSDLSKLKSLEIMITKFKMEKSRFPATLDEMVKEDYASERDILDHNNKKFHYENGKVSANK